MLRCSALSGYSVAGLTDKLIATLYADDTTVYLAEQDSYADLQVILTSWCRASGAKFNVKKTEIIPLGTAAFRARLLDSRRLNADDAPIPPGIRIAKDGEATRILGTWPGNKVDSAGIWSLTKDKVLASLSRWEEKHPTLNGRSILTHTVVGGFTQYLTASQGMPAHVEKALESVILDFFWGHVKQRPVNMQTLRRRKLDGGLGVLHIGARNDAQYMTWLGEYLSDGADRPPWAYLADRLFQEAIIAKDVPRAPVDQRTNPFEQDWRPNPRKLPFILKCLLTTARRYHLVLDAPFIPAEVKNNVHVWTHPAMMETNIWRGMGWKTRCLRVKHEVHTVEDLEEIAELDESDHDDDSDCECANCDNDRLHGCLHPHRCRTTASDVLAAIAEKWSPCAGEDDRERPLAALFSDDAESALEAGELVVADTARAGPRRVSDMYRLCGHALAINRRTAAETLRGEAPPPWTAHATGEAVQVIICAAVTKVPTEDSVASFAVHFPDGEYQDIGLACASQPGSYFDAMVMALLRVTDMVPSTHDIHVVTPSKSFARAFTTDLQSNVDTGWLSWGQDEVGMRTAAAAIRAREGETAFLWVQKRRMKAWPEVRTVQQKARLSATAPTRLRLADNWHDVYDVPGISIKRLRQSAAHRAIQRSHEITQEPRWRTLESLTLIKDSLQRNFDIRVTDQQIWRGLWSRDFSRKARNFLWKTIHGAHKVGQYFAKMPEPWRAKKDCPTCGTLESMDHILFHCLDSGQEIVWPLAEERIERRATGITLDLGSALGIACVPVGFSDGGRDHDAERALRIIVSEAVFLIWKLRCKKRIEHAGEDWHHNPNEIRNVWNGLMSSREAQDTILDRKRSRPQKDGEEDRAARQQPAGAATTHQHAPLLTNPGVLVGPVPGVRGGVG